MTKALQGRTCRLVRPARHGLALAITLAVSGCAVYGDKHDVDRTADNLKSTTQNRVRHELDRVTLDQKRASQEVNLPFLASQPRPIARDLELPPSLQNAMITGVYTKGGEADLLTIARRIQDASGILVEVTPDALLPLSAFGPRLSQTAVPAAALQAMAQNAQPARLDTLKLDDPIMPPDGAAGTTSASAAPVAITAPVSSASHVPRVPAIKAGQQKLSAVLDEVTVPLGLYWRPENNGHKIVIYRTETRMFEIRGAETNTQANLDLSLTGSIGQTGNNTVDSKSENKTELPKSEGSPLADVRRKAMQFMTAAGTVAEAAGNVLIVTDTKAALDRIQLFVDAENKTRGRRTEMVLEEITLEVSQSSQSGVNWNLLFNSAAPGVSTGSLVNIGGLNSLLEQQGAAASLGLGVANGPWKGSSIALQALSKVGKVIDVRTDSGGATNGRPITFGRPEHRAYPDKLQQTQSVSDNSRPTVSVSQSVEAWGRIVSVIPFAYANGDVRLAFKYDNQEQPIFERRDFGDGSYVVSPWAKGSVMARDAVVHSGQPYVVWATTQDAKSYNENRVDRNAPVALGGSDIADNTQRVTLLVLTPMVQER